MLNNFKRALEWRKAGVSTFPLSFKTKRPIVKWSKYREEIPTPIEIKRFFTSYNTNLAIVCGGTGGLAVIDFDNENGYKFFTYALPDGLRQLFDSTYRVKTPRGVHAYFWSEGMCSLKDFDRKIDVKAEGGYVVAPMSIHPSGKEYKDFNGFNIGNIKSLPPKVIEGLFPKQKEKLETDWSSVSSQNGKDDGYIFPRGDFDLQEIRNRFPILQLAMQYTPMFREKRNSNRRWKGKCPLPSHPDTDPSFWVDTETGLCGCFGNCELNRKATDVIGLYAKIHGISYGEAIKELREM